MCARGGVQWAAAFDDVRARACCHLVAGRTRVAVRVQECFSCPTAPKTCVPSPSTMARVAAPSCRPLCTRYFGLLACVTSAVCVCLSVCVCVCVYTPRLAMLASESALLHTSGEECRPKAPYGRRQKHASLKKSCRRLRPMRQTAGPGLPPVPCPLALPCPATDSSRTGWERHVGVWKRRCGRSG